MVYQAWASGSSFSATLSTGSAFLVTHWHIRQLRAFSLVGTTRRECASVWMGTSIWDTNKRHARWATAKLASIASLHQ